MKIGIKSYRSCAGNEGDAFSCTLYLDGKKAALVKYDGWGGQYDYDFTFADGRPWGGPTCLKFKEHVESLPERTCSFDDPGTGEPAKVAVNMDMLVEDAIQLMLENRQLRRWCRNETLFRVKGDDEGSWRRLNVKFPGNEGRVRYYLSREHGDAIEEIANERFA